MTLTLSLARVLAWAQAHQHRLLVLGGLAFEAAAYLGNAYGGPPWLQIGHALFLVLVGAGVISTASASKVSELETAVSALQDDAPDTMPSGRDTVPDHGSPTPRA